MTFLNTRYVITMAKLLPCIFCTQSTPFPPPPIKDGSIKEEETFRFLCNILKIHSTTFIPFPICDDKDDDGGCRAVFNKLSHLHEELGRVQEAISLLSTKIKGKIEESAAKVEFPSTEIKVDNDAEERTLEFVKAFRDKVVAAAPAPETSPSTIDIDGVFYVVNQLQEITDEGEERTDFYEAGGVCDDIIVTVSTHDGEGFDGCEEEDLGSEQAATKETTKRGKSSRKRKPEKSPKLKSVKKERKRGIRPPKENLPYKCNQCPWSFNMPHKLKLHMSIHTGVGKFKCEQCNQDYKTSNALKTHNVKMHGSGKPYVCDFDQCHKTFILASGLRLHKGSHVETLTCSVCDDGKEFKSRHIWRRHMKTHDAESQTQSCCFCPLKYNRREDCIGHMIRMHRAEEGSRTCNICTKSFDTAIELITHVYTHASDREIKCQGCDMSFSTRDEFRVHNEEKHGITCPKFPCPKCHLLLLSAKSYSMHMKLHKPISALSQKAIDSAKSSGSSSKSFTCFVCHEEFPSRTLLQRHKLEAHKDVVRKTFKCTKCVLTFDDAETLRDHIENHTTDDSLICELCDKQFRNATSFKRHHLTHRAGGKPFPCQHCNYSSRRKDDLKKHERIMHPADGSVRIKKQRLPAKLCPTPCDVCGKIFPSIKGCRQHKSMFHTHPLVTYQCEHCGKMSKRRKDLLLHLRVHLEQPKIVCDVCNKEFKSIQNLQRHVKVVHEDNGRPYICDLCDKGFKRKDDAYKHISLMHRKYSSRKHSHVLFKPLKTTKQEKRTTPSKLGLDSVIELDANIDELKCQYCAKYFVSFGVLEEHLLQHTGISDNVSVKKLERNSANFKIIVTPTSVG